MYLLYVRHCDSIYTLFLQYFAYPCAVLFKAQKENGACWICSRKGMQGYALSGREQPLLSLKWPPLLVTNQHKITCKNVHTNILYYISCLLHLNLGASLSMVLGVKVTGYQKCMVTHTLICIKNFFTKQCVITILIAQQACSMFN